MIVRETELRHYGVKGMKWGVRRYQNYDGTLIKSYDINTMDEKKLYKTINSGKDFIINKNQKAYRVTTSKKESLKGQKYVSMRKEDIKIYEQMVLENSINKKNIKLYTNTYTTKNNLKTAGFRSQMIAYNKVLGKDSSKYKHQSIDEIIDEICDNSENIADIFNAKNDFSNGMRKYLINSGYDAVVDMCDTTIGYANAPIIILDSKKSIKK